MIDLKNYVEMAEDISKMERVMSNLFHYSRARGGGILWAIIYWFLYFFSIYEISSISHGLPNLLELIGFTALFIVGCFLIYAVSWQMSTLNRWHKQQFKDYKAVYKETKRLLLDKNILQENIGQELNQLFLDFENRYFPKK